MRLSETFARASMWLEARRTSIDLATVIAGPPDGSSDHKLLVALESADRATANVDAVALRGELRKARV